MEGIIAIIPARIGSSRFPGKPLAPLLDRPMIEHVYRRTKMCRLLNDVYVATCDEEIKVVVEQFGGKVVMTSSTHERATDRVAEAAELIEFQGEKITIVVMVQGDEPMITSSMIEEALRPMLQDDSISCVNLAKRIVDMDDYSDPNTIKVVKNLNDDALYFSRTPIPAVRSEDQWELESGIGDASPVHKQGNALPVYKQVCVIPFRRDFLIKLAQLPPTPLEQAESIDMLRALEHGEKIRLVETEVECHAVDTPEDLRRVERLMRKEVAIEE